MSTVLKNLVREPNSAIACKSFLDWHNYVVPQLMTEAQVRERIMRTMAGARRHSDVRAAIQRGFDAAKRTPEPEPEPPASESAEEEMPVPKNGMIDARFVARSRRVFAQKRTANDW
jgi:hypothetical protein